MSRAKIKFKPKRPSIQCLKHQNPPENAFQPGRAVGAFKDCQYKQVTFYNDLWLGLQREKPRSAKIIYLYF